MITEDTLAKALDPKLTLTESVNMLLEAADLKSGARVAILDDGSGSSGAEGIMGTVKGPSANKGAGFLDIELPNKSVIPIAANMLLPV